MEEGCMVEKQPRKLPNGMVDTESYMTEDGREEIPMGVNHDGSQTFLTPYINIDGVQVHPERLEEYLKQIEEAEKKPDHS